MPLDLIPPPDAAKLVPEPVLPITVAVIGGTGDGGNPIPSGTIAKTPDSQPNLVIAVVTPIAAIAIRFGNNYLTSLLGLITAGVTGAIKAEDFGHLLLTCAGLALAGPAVMLIKDVITIFSGLEKRYPLTTGSI